MPYGHMCRGGDVAHGGNVGEGGGTEVSCPILLPTVAIHPFLEEGVASLWLDGVVDRGIAEDGDAEGLKCRCRR